MFNDYITFIKERFKEKLPGEEAHMRMAPLGRRALNYYLSLNIEYRNGSVLGHLYPINNEPHLLFIKRSDDGKTHSGQIAFPGGKQDAADNDLQETALREAFEEVGIKPNEVNVIGQLSNLYIPVSKFMVQPFVSYSNHEPVFKLSEREVEKVIPLSVKELSNPAIIKTKRIKTFDGIIKDAPCYIINGETIWGATAMMLSELLEMSEGFLQRG
ncbi:MAG: CoA pyrophosphatase [Bacteroidia bacterium]